MVSWKSSSPIHLHFLSTQQNQLFGVRQTKSCSSWVILGVRFPDPKPPFEIFSHVGFIALFRLPRVRDDRKLITETALAHGGRFKLERTKLRQLQQTNTRQTCRIVACNSASKASKPSSLKDSGIVILSKDLQPWKAPSPMNVTD